jgi:UDPglucose--hexose-1-phosphate uridylyltransferase
MSEFRRDPFTGHWRLFAEGRSSRPNEYGPTPEPPTGAEACPFCEGREVRTPGEFAAVRRAGGSPNGPGWQVRSFPNRFPTLEPGGGGRSATPDDFFRRVPGSGRHEVIVTAPAHAPGLADFAADHARTVVRFFRDRVRSAEALPEVRTAILLENKGPESGGTLPHPHAQLLASAVVPDRIAEETDVLARTEGCALERLVDREVAAVERIVAADTTFVVLAPFASEHPLELWIVPRRHAASIATALDAEIDELARLLPRCLRALDAVRPGASYNWFVHGLAPSDPAVARFHWHLELTPRLHRADGFELAAGIPVNSILPEVAATEYRHALAARPGAENKG